MTTRLNQRRLSLMIITASVLFTSVFTLAVSTRTAVAQTVQDYGLKSTAQMAGIPVGETNPIKIAATIINVVLGLVGVLAVILIIYAGFAWMTAAGNEEKIGKAKKVLTGAIIGLLIIMASFIISSFVMRNVMDATKSKEVNQNVCGSVSGEICLASEDDCATVNGTVSNYKTCNEPDAKICCTNVP